MPKSKPILLSVIVLILASLACAVPTASAPLLPTADQNFWNTAIAQTVAVALTQTQSVPSLAPMLQVTDTPVMTFTPEPPTLSPTATLSPTPILTSTPLVPLISVSVATNCRVGPGKVYDRVGALLVGQVAEVYGVNPIGNYWYISNPNVTGGFCWLWGEYASLSGNVGALPVYTPPPTPTPRPDFDASYSGLETCSGWWVDIDLENTGGVTFKSVSVTVRDTVTETSVSVFTDGFTDKDGCVDVSTRDNLNPGGTRTVSSAAFAYDPSGHKMRATITACTNLGQNGTCVTEVIEFKP